MLLEAPHISYQIRSGIVHLYPLVGAMAPPRPREKVRLAGEAEPSPLRMWYHASLLCYASSIVVPGQSRSQVVRSGELASSPHPCYTQAMKLALKLTPQRSTQYSNMVEVLARPELLASPLRASISAVEQMRLGGQSYLLANFAEAGAP